MKLKTIDEPDGEFEELVLRCEKMLSETSIKENRYDHFTIKKLAEEMAEIGYRKRVVNDFFKILDDERAAGLYSEIKSIANSHLNYFIIAMNLCANYIVSEKINLESFECVRKWAEICRGYMREYSQKMSMDYR
ncbi:MAG: hypothetical protein NC253_09430 [Ruminococcus sp.]|nr:hypothetical protein [Ruminococcus sp.]MCM1380856.1 hypothetical protein [Muribaculaceae bacterium]MCM1478993.1 hypothetical protein [Muribaculaceae bacterium]